MKSSTDNDNSFYCDVNDLLLRLPKMLSGSDIRNIIRVSAHARHFAVMCLNAARSIERRILTRDNASYRLIDILCRANGDCTRMLYAPLACRTEYDESSGTVVTLNIDVYDASRIFLKREIKDSRVDLFADGNDSEKQRECDLTSETKRIRSENFIRDTNVDRLRRNLERYKKTIDVDMPDEFKMFGPQNTSRVVDTVVETSNKRTFYSLSCLLRR